MYVSAPVARAMPCVWCVPSHVCRHGRSCSLLMVCATPHVHHQLFPLMRVMFYMTLAGVALNAQLSPRWSTLAQPPPVLVSVPLCPTTPTAASLCSLPRDAAAAAGLVCNASLPAFASLARVWARAQTCGPPWVQLGQALQAEHAAATGVAPPMVEAVGAAPRVLASWSHVVVRLGMVGALEACTGMFTGPLLGGLLDVLLVLHERLWNARYRVGVRLENAPRPQA